MAASPSRSSSSTAETKKFAQRSLLPASAASTGAMSPWPSAALRIAASSAPPVALGHHRQDRAVVALEHAFEGAGEARIAARDAAGLVDGRDRHRRVLEEAHEAHFRRALRIGAVIPGAIEHQRARGAGRAVGAERHFMEQAHRHRLAAAGLEIEVEHLGLDFAGRGIERGEQRRALAGDDIGQLERAGADLGEIVIEPGGQRGVEINNVATGIDREEAGRRMIEIVDGVLQLLEHVFLALAVARHVGDRPHRHARVALVGAERAHAHAQPARGLAGAPAMRTSSCSRRPSRAALSRR